MKIHHLKLIQSLDSLKLRLRSRSRLKSTTRDQRSLGTSKYKDIVKNKHVKLDREKKKKLPPEVDPLRPRLRLSQPTKFQANPILGHFSFFDEFFTFAEWLVSIQNILFSFQRRIVFLRISNYVLSLTFYLSKVFLKVVAIQEICIHIKQKATVLQK